MSTARDSTPLSYHSSPEDYTGNGAPIHRFDPNSVTGLDTESHVSTTPLHQSAYDAPQTQQPRARFRLRRRHSLATPKGVHACIPPGFPSVNSPPPPTASETEIRALRSTQARLITSLQDTTARCSRLLTRTRIQEADGLVAKALVDSIRAEKEELAEEKDGMRWWVTVLAVLLGLVGLGMGAFVVICWVRGPEMEYVRRRRAEVLGE